MCTLPETTRRVPLRRFITIPEIAKAKGISRVAVLYAIRTGKLRAYRVPGNRTWLIVHRDAVDYIDTPVRGRVSKEV